MATPIQPENHPLSIEELRKKRVNAIPWGSLPPLATSLEISDRGPLPVLFRKRSHLEMDAAEQMVPLTPQELYQLFTHVMGAWFGFQVHLTPLPVPGMPAQPNGPTGTPASGTPTPA